MERQITGREGGREGFLTSEFAAGWSLDLSVVQVELKWMGRELVGAKRLVIGSERLRLF